MRKPTFRTPDPASCLDTHPAMRLIRSVEHGACCSRNPLTVSCVEVRQRLVKRSAIAAYFSSHVGLPVQDVALWQPLKQNHTWPFQRKFPFVDPKITAVKPWRTSLTSRQLNSPFLSLPTKCPTKVTVLPVQEIVNSTSNMEVHSNGRCVSQDNWHIRDAFEMPETGEVRRQLPHSVPC